MFARMLKPLTSLSLFRSSRKRNMTLNAYVSTDKLQTASAPQIRYC